MMKLRPPAVHDLKTWTDPFNAIWDAQKSFEYRKNDRNFCPGDYLILKEWHLSLDAVNQAASPLPPGYSGRVIWAKVSYVLVGGEFGLPKEYCIMQIEVLQKFENKGTVKDVM